MAMVSFFYGAHHTITLANKKWFVKSSKRKRAGFCVVSTAASPLSFLLGLVVPDFPMEIPDLPAPSSYREPLPVTATRGCLFPLATAITLTLSKLITLVGLCQVQL